MSSTASMSNAAKDAANDAKDTVRDASKAASEGMKDFQDDFEALRGDVARLTEQFGDLLTARGTAAWRKAKKTAEGVISDAGAKTHDAAGAAQELGDSVLETFHETLNNRPYATLAVAVGIGFLFGATMRR